MQAITRIDIEIFAIIVDSKAHQRFATKRT